MIQQKKKKRVEDPQFFIFWKREMIFISFEVVDSPLFLKLIELKKCDITITKLWKSNFLYIGNL